MSKGSAVIYILVGILFLAVLGGAYYFAAGKNIVSVPFKKSPILCTQEAKQCPDGSFVGREGPNCEFKPCLNIKPSPSLDETTNWKTYKNEELGISFKYPLAVDDSHKGAGIELPNIRVLLPVDSNDIGEKNLFITYIKNWPTSSQKKEGNPNIKIESITVANEKAVIVTEQFSSIGVERIDVRFTKNSINYNFRILYKLENKEKTLMYFNQILSTFKFLDQEEVATEDLQVWRPVCQELGLTDFEIQVSPGDGITHLARKAIGQYFNNVTLSKLNSTTPRLNAEESVYAEDYIRKNVAITNLSRVKTVQTSCKVVEEATLKARLLTITQKQNLEKYSEKVPELELNAMLESKLEELYNEASGLKPYSGVIRLGQ